jgi:homoserine kinase type II
MSVFTPVSRQQLDDFLGHFDCGELKDFAGISAGIENSNFFVTTTSGHYVLTLFETLTLDELPFFLDLMAYLAEHGLPSAHPLADASGSYLRVLNDRPAALVQRLRGASVDRPDVGHCRAVGDMLGRLHTVGLGFPEQRRNNRGAAWRQQARDRLRGHLADDDQILLDDELAWQQSHDDAGLPAGVIHADLFRDNVLFDGNELSGLIDFYYACNDTFLYDLAVTVNDWCSDDDGALESSRTRALLQAYHQQRPLSPRERDAWPGSLRAAALRFWLSRLHDAHFQREGEITHTKNPREFRRILCQRRDRQTALLAIWDAAQRP